MLCGFVNIAHRGIFLIFGLAILNEMPVLLYSVEAGEWSVVVVQMAKIMQFVYRIMNKISSETLVTLIFDFISINLPLYSKLVNNSA